MKDNLTQKKTLDLQKIKKTIFDDIEILLNDLNIEYEHFKSSYFSRCPIHDGSDNNRGFSICKDKRSWKCWTRGCHDEYGKDIFGLIKGVLSKRENKAIEFSDILRYICKLYNIDRAKTQKQKTEIIVDDFKQIVDIFITKNYNNTCSVQPIQIADSCPYFESRGFLKSTLKHFGVGDCITKCELKNRAIVPVHDIDKNVVGYIGRAIKPYITPKFLFSKGFNKTNYLYNHHRALESIIKTSCLFIVEGQGDVWKLYEAGVNNCVSIFGKEISEVQKNKILNMNLTTLVVLTDDDQAGRDCKFQMQRHFSRMFSMKFPILTSKDVGVMSVEKVKNEILPQVKGLY